jgi:hypothetical protein
VARTPTYTPIPLVKVVFSVDSYIIPKNSVLETFFLKILSGIYLKPIKFKDGGNPPMILLLKFTGVASYICHNMCVKSLYFTSQKLPSPAL